MSQNAGSKAGGVVIAFAIGAVIGAGMALLYAPQSGKNTRGMLANKGRELGGKAKGAFEHGKELLHDRKADLVAAVDGGRDAMREERAKNQTHG